MELHAMIEPPIFPIKTDEIKEEAKWGDIQITSEMMIKDECDDFIDRSFPKLEETLPMSPSLIEDAKIEQTPKLEWPGNQITSEMIIKEESRDFNDDNTTNLVLRNLQRGLLSLLVQDMKELQDSHRKQIRQVNSLQRDTKNALKSISQSVEGLHCGLEEVSLILMHLTDSNK